MTNSTIPTLEIYSPSEQQRYNRSPQCMLKWRQGQLLVSVSQKVKQPYLPPLESEQGLVECLKHSPVRLVRVDPRLGEARLRFWADACEQAKKPVFLRVPSAQRRLKKRNRLSWWLKRLIDGSAALLLVMVLSPVMLGLVLLMRADSPGPIFSRQWHVGERGKLFRVLTFRTTEVNDDSRTTPLGRWMCKYGLEKLPQLFNVLRGEITLVGPRPCHLSDAVRLSPEGQKQLNKLPGIICTLAGEARANQMDLDKVPLWYR